MSFIKHVKDPAPLAEVGGSSRIDSLNNVFMLRAEPHEEFDAYNMSFHPGVRLLTLYFLCAADLRVWQRGFEVIAWQSSADDFAGMHVNFDHIVNPDLMPAPFVPVFFRLLLLSLPSISELFEHQMWLALMRKFRGAGEEYFDEDDALDDGQGLSTRPEIWTQGQGKARFEMLFAHRLQGHAAAQEAAAAAALA